MESINRTSMLWKEVREHILDEQDEEAKRNCYTHGE